jgi:hypothetical protein
LSRAEIAQHLHISKEYVDDAATVLRDGALNVIAMVDNAEVNPKSAATAVSGRAKSEQQDWTADDVKRIGNAKVRAWRQTKAPKERPPNVYTILNRWRPPPLPDLTPEQGGPPPKEIAGEQDPDSPPGVSRALAHVRKHGHVQYHSIQEKEQIELTGRLKEFAVFVMRIANDDCPTPDDLARLTPENAAPIRHLLNKYLGPAQMRLASYASATQADAGARATR